MISEMVNALVLTFLLTEYILSEERDYNTTTAIGLVPGRGGGDGGWWSSLLLLVRRQFIEQPRIVISVIILLIVVNVIERYNTEFIDVINRWLQQLYHVPKIALVAVTYITVLYIDCRRFIIVKDNNKRLPFFTDFIPKVFVGFLYVLPAYPALAVLISFGFLFLINIFEFFHWKVELLEQPIYYGVLYGPFSYVYYVVKRRITEDINRLPT